MKELLIGLVLGIILVNINIYVAGIVFLFIGYKALTQKK